MAEEVPFQELIRRVRQGDEAAAAVLVRHYEPAIRRAVRFRLLDTRLGAVRDSTYICQSVLASFFVRAAAELLREVARRLTPEERRLVELRRAGADWEAIAGQLGSTAVALRKRLSRAVDRVTRELGLDEATDE